MGGGSEPQMIPFAEPLRYAHDLDTLPPDGRRYIEVVVDVRRACSDLRCGRADRRGADPPAAGPVPLGQAPRPVAEPMTGQTSIPVDESQPTTGPCAWCGKPARSKIEMEPPVRGTDKMTGVQVIKRRAIEAWACPAHLASLRPSDRAARVLTREDKKAGGSKGKGIVIR
jgi:hypothetical protein